MSDMLKYIQIQNQDGSYGNQIPLSVDSVNVFMANDDNLEVAMSKKADKTEVQSLQAAVGSPLTAITASAMIDTNKIYIYTGSETGYTNGDWYYWNGTAWIDGGVYNAVALATDSTLTQSGQAADAKVVGDEISDLKSTLNDLYDNIFVPTMTNGKYVPYNTGVLANDADSAATDYIPVKEGRQVRLRNLFLTGTRSVCWYSAAGYGGYFTYGTSDTELLITVPSTAIAIRATARVNQTVEVHYVGEINERLDILAQRIEKEKSSVKPLHFQWSKFQTPSSFPFLIPFNIYTDGHNFKTDFKFTDYLNTGGTTYYTAPNAPSTNDGLSRISPKNFGRAYLNAVDGDTIVLLEGDYDRNSFVWNNIAIQKNINIIGEGKCRIFAGQLGMTFTQSSGYTNVYQTTRSAAVRIIDYKSVEDEYLAYTLKSSVAEVEATEGSYYIDGSTVYVHAIGHGNPSSKVCVTVNSETFLDVNNNEQNTKVVYQNIELIGKATGILFERKNTSNTLEVICDNIRCYHCGNTNNDSFKVYGGTAIFNNCKAICSYKDGFNYNGLNLSNQQTDTLCIEIDCIGSSCGLLQSGQSQNGSTGHVNSKIVRINGKYFDNYGANVADVQDDTYSINLGCKAFYSSADTVNANFSAQQSGVTMWLYGCVAVGATKDISCVSGSTVYLDKCTYKEKGGSGTINEQNTLPFDIYTLYKTSEIG